MQTQSFMTHEAILSVIDGMARKLAFYLDNRERGDIAMVGIRTGGAIVAEHLHDRLDLSEELGVLDISFYRDDFSRIGLNPEVKPSQIPFDIDDRHIVLIDDVLHTGRTIRAALNEIFDYGRPKSVTLVALIERSGRELPIQPDIVGAEVILTPNEQITLTGKDIMELVIGSNE